MNFTDSRQLLKMIQFHMQSIHYPSSIIFNSNLYQLSNTLIVFLSIRTFLGTTCSSFDYNLVYYNVTTICKIRDSHSKQLIILIKSSIKLSKIFTVTSFLRNSFSIICTEGICVLNCYSKISLVEVSKMQPVLVNNKMYPLIFTETTL